MAMLWQCMVIYGPMYRHILLDFSAPVPYPVPMNIFNDQNQISFTGPAGSLLTRPDDEITLKLAMLISGQCEGLGPTRAATRFGYSKARYFQLLHLYLDHGALALQSQPTGPKSNYRRTDEIVRQIIRHRFLDPEASAAVIAQKLEQTHHVLSIRSVHRVIADYGLQKKTLRP